jgi:hypothetical protein
MAASGIDVAVVWLDSREPKGNRLWCALSHDGGATFGKDFLVHGSKEGICPCCHPSLCIGSHGLFALWRDAIDGNRDMYTGAIGFDGKPAASKAVSPAHWRLDACPMDGGGLAVTDAGQPVCTFRRDNAVYWASGGREHRLADGHNPVIAIGSPIDEDKKALAVWEAEGHLRAIRFDPGQKEVRKDPRIGEPEPLDLGPGAFATLAPRFNWFTVAGEIDDHGCKRIGIMDL